MGGLSLTKTVSSVSSRTLKAKPPVQCTSSRRPTLKPDNSDIDQTIQHKFKEGKVTHKRAEQKRRNELSSLITELEHLLPSKSLCGCQPKNQKPGYTKRHFESRVRFSQAPGHSDRGARQDH